MQAFWTTVLSRLVTPFQMGAIIMVADIVISANFSDSSSRILAGTSEDTLEATSLCVSDVRNQPMNAVKALGGQMQNGAGD